MQRHTTAIRKLGIPSRPCVVRKNHDLKTQLATYVNADHTTWSERLPAVIFTMNGIGYTAAALTFGRELRIPYDVQHDLREFVQEHNRAYSDSKRQPNPGTTLVIKF